VTAVEVATALVVMLKVALVAPAATVTLAGTVAAGLLLPSATCAPPAGAGPLSVTVPVTGVVAPVTLAELKESDEATGGSTVSETLCVRPPYEAEMLPLADAATALVVTLNVALVAPAAIATLAGTDAAGLLLESATWAPPLGAGPSRVTVPLSELPPVTLDWLRLSAETLGGTTVSEALWLPP